MDQLDLLKKDWKKQESSLPKYSQNELSKLIHKKSSSIVKWILIVSVLEFLLPHIVYLFVDYKKIGESYNDIKMGNLIWYAYGVAYLVIVYFIYRFYKNYRSITANDSTKELLQSIIKTRRTVKHYIWFNLAMIPVIGGITLYYYFQSPLFTSQIPQGFNNTMLWIISFVVILIIMLVFWLFYQLIYGIFLRRLKANYNELIKDGNGNL